MSTFWIGTANAIRGVVKISSEHFEKIVAHFKNVGAEQIKKHRAYLLSPENPRPPKDLEMRLRWDVMNSMPSLLRIPLFNALYKAGLNDSHIDTALKAAMKEVCPQSTLHDYATGEFIREATPNELRESREAANHDGGAGVIRVDGKSCYVSE